MEKNINERKIWYQLQENNPLGTPKESNRSFELFEIYLKYGSDRTIDKVAKKVEKSNAYISKLSLNYKWSERAESYDQWKNDLALEQHEKTLQKEAELHQTEWIQKRSKLRTEEFDTGIRLINTGNKILDQIFNNPLDPVVIRKNVKNRYELQSTNNSAKKEKVLTGFDETTVIGNNFELIDRVVKSIEAGFKLCRNSIDLPVGVFNHTFGNLPTSAEDLLALSDEERENKLKDLENAEKFFMNILKERGESLDDLMVSTAEN